MEQMNTRERVALLLNSHKMTPQEFAKLVGVSPSSVNGMMRGRIQTVTRTMAQKICNALPSVSFDWLLTGMGDPFNITTTQPLLAQNVQNSTAQTITQNANNNTLTNCNSCQTVKQLTNTIQQQAETIAQLLQMLKK